MSSIIHSVGRAASAMPATKKPSSLILFKLAMINKEGNKKMAE